MIGNSRGLAETHFCIAIVPGARIDFGRAIQGKLPGIAPEFSGFGAVWISRRWTMRLRPDPIPLVGAVRLRFRRIRGTRPRRICHVPAQWLR